MNGNQYLEYRTLARCNGLTILRSIGDDKIPLDVFSGEVVVTLDECRIGRLGHYGAIDNCFHHIGCVCVCVSGDAVRVSDQVGGFQS